MSQRWQHESLRVPRALARRCGPFTSTQWVGPLLALLTIILGALAVQLHFSRSALSLPVLLADLVIVATAVALEVLGQKRRRDFEATVREHRGLVCTECGHPHDRDEEIVRCPECGAELDVAKARASWASAIKGANFQPPPPPR